MLDKPIRYKYKGKYYILRYKTPEQWEEFGHLNSHIETKYWDNPVITKNRRLAARRAGQDEDQKPISVEEWRREQRQKKQAARSPVERGEDKQDSRGYRQEKTDESLRRRRTKTLEKKLQKKASEEDYQHRKKIVSRARGVDKKLSRLKNPLSKGKGYGRRMRAISASVVIAMAVSWFWFVQLGFWVLGVAAISSVDLLPIDSLENSSVLTESAKASAIALLTNPGESIWWFSNIVITTIGIGSMLFAIGVYTLRRVSCFSGWKGLCFIFSIALYMAPFINGLFPWIFLWMASVIVSREE